MICQQCHDFIISAHVFVQQMLQTDKKLRAKAEKFAEREAKAAKKKEEMTKSLMISEVRSEADVYIISEVDISVKTEPELMIEGDQAEYIKTVDQKTSEIVEDENFDESESKCSSNFSEGESSKSDIVFLKKEVVHEAIKSHSEFCELCQKKVKNLEVHNFKVHKILPDRGSYYCKACKYCFLYQSQFNEHEKGCNGPNGKKHPWNSVRIHRKDLSLGCKINKKLEKENGIKCHKNDQ